jgi:hypothetical protein
MCTDPLEAAKFLQLVTMIRTVAAGAPIFGTPNVFIKTLKQEGPIGLFLKPFMEPIVLPPSAAKALTAESKMFSFYVTGYVKSGKRETRTKIHAVVDFRGAPPPPDVAALLKLAESGALQALADQAAAQAQQSGAPAAPTVDDNGFPAFLTPSPGGRVVYFRID